MDRQPRQIEIGREGDHALAVLGVERPVAAHIHIESGLHLRHLHVEGLAPCTELTPDGPRHDGRLLLQRRHRDRAIIDIHHMMAARRHVTHMHFALGEAHMQRQPATAFAMGVDHGFERRVETRLAQGVRQRILLPGAIEIVPHVLRRAAAAFSEIGTERRRALRGGRVDADELRTRAIPFDGDRFAGQGEGDEERTRSRLGDPVRLRAEAGDRHVFSQGGLPTRIHDCRHHPRWGTAPAPPARGRARR